MSTRDPIAEALALRNWALPLVLDIDDRISNVEPPPEASSDAWRLFLTSERCAIPLHSVVERLNIPLTREAGEELRWQRMEELKRSLSAHGQLRQLVELASQRRWKMVALKGGLEIARGRAVAVADLDVLLERSEGIRLAAELDASGEYRPGNVDPREGGGRTSGHLAPRVAPGGVQVEIHYLVSGLDDPGRLLAEAREVAGMRGLWQLHPRDHLYHLLWHATEHHPDRVGRLRELRLVAFAARDASAEDLREVRKRARELPRWREMLGQLRVAAGAAALERGDTFGSTAALRYLLIGSRRLNSAPLRIRIYLGRAIFLIGAGPGALRSWLAELLAPVGQPLSRPALRGLESRLPRLFDYLRRGVRLATALGVLPVAWLLVRRAARHGHPPGGERDPFHDLDPADAPDHGAIPTARSES